MLTAKRLLGAMIGMALWGMWLQYDWAIHKLYRLPSPSHNQSFPSLLDVKLGTWTSNHTSLAQEFGGFHTTTLTHVVITIQTLQEHWDVHKEIKSDWESTSPCENWLELGRCGKEIYPQNPTTKPHLAVWVLDGVVSETNELWQVLASSQAVQTCFAGWSLRVRSTSRGLSLDEQVLGSAGRCLGGTEVGYVLLQRGSSNRKRANWLTLLASSVLFPVPAYWIMVPLPIHFPKLTKADGLSVYRMSTRAKHNSVVIGVCNSSSNNQDNGELVDVDSDTLPYMYFTHLRSFGRQALLLATNSSSEVCFPLQLILNYYLHYGLRKHYDLIRFNLAHRVMISPTLASLYSQQATPPPPHESKITHLVVAFNSVPRQFGRLNKTLTVWWKNFAPCRGLGDYAVLHSWSTNCQSSSNQVLPDLVLLATRRSMMEIPQEAAKNDELLEEQILRDIVPLIPSSSKQCFGKITICVVRLTPYTDSYLTGSRILYERFLQGDCTGSSQNKLGHALYIEPDARPVKPGWFTSIASTVVHPNPPSWIVGSMFQGDSRQTMGWPSQGYLWHFNGNGVYNLDPNGFPKYYFTDVVRPFMTKTFGSRAESPMDIDITSAVSSLFFPSQNEPYLFPKDQLRHDYVEKLKFDALLRVEGPLPRDEESDLINFVKFAYASRYTNLIFNKYKSSWTRQELSTADVQLVHGGYCGSECK
ncbi:hypothetical protein BASA81_002251 [Batrachochytrium salamandrivorans]|nr:hypothetical protein BASA81_002251 [Batrachochytrium salamandrivorans]